jgi:four helix bundle protein
MATIKKFEDILAWQKARELNKYIYNITKDGAFSKDFDLRSQIRRSSISIMSNIAEGFERRGDKEFIRFINISKGSCAELRSQLYAALDVDYINVQTFEELMRLANETGRLLQGFKTYLKTTESVNLNSLETI